MVLTLKELISGVGDAHGFDKDHSIRASKLFNSKPPRPVRPVTFWSAIWSTYTCLWSLNRGYDINKLFLGKAYIQFYRNCKNVVTDFRTWSLDIPHSSDSGLCQEVGEAIAVENGVKFGQLSCIDVEPLSSPYEDPFVFYKGLVNPENYDVVDKAIKGVYKSWVDFKANVGKFRDGYFADKEKRIEKIRETMRNVPSTVRQ